VSHRDALDGERLANLYAFGVEPESEALLVDEFHKIESRIIRAHAQVRTHHDFDNAAGEAETKETKVSLVRVLPAWFHAIADYAVGFGLIIIALAVGGSGKAVATGVVVGAVVLLVSMLTKYPLGVKKVLPFTIHSGGDYLAAFLLIVAPFALDFNTTDKGLTAVYLVAGIAVLLVSLITNYQYSDKRDWNSSKAVPATA
jgi:hypothetical protein